MYFLTHCIFVLTDVGLTLRVKPQLQIRLTQYDPHAPDDPFRTINYHHLDISGHDGMDEQDIGWRNGWADEDFGSE